MLHTMRTNRHLIPQPRKKLKCDGREREGNDTDLFLLFYIEMDNTMIYLQNSYGNIISYDLYPLNHVLYLRRICSEDFTISENRILLYRDGFQLDDMDTLYLNDVITLYVIPNKSTYSNELQSYKLVY